MVSADVLLECLFQFRLFCSAFANHGIYLTAVPAACGFYYFFRFLLCMDRVPMLLLQAVAVVFYYAQLVSLYAYLPEMKRDVGQEKMAGFTSSFQSIQFGTQAGFLVVIAGIVFAVKSGAVLTAQISQGVNTVCVSIFLSVGWLKYLGSRKAVRELPEGHSLILEGFRTNFKTMVNIQKHFKKGIRWFFIAIAFGQAGTFSRQRRNIQRLHFQLYGKSLV